MALFSFHVTDQGTSPDHVVSASFEGNDSARREAVAICADLARDAFARLTANAEWQMTVVDQTGKTVFRFRICEEHI